jgi:hypothetical protein
VPAAGLHIMVVQWDNLCCTSWRLEVECASITLLESSNIMHVHIYRYLLNLGWPVMVYAFAAQIKTELCGFCERHLVSIHPTMRQ